MAVLTNQPGLFVWSMLLLSALSARVAAAPADTEPPEHWYQVDVVLFKPVVPNMAEEGRQEVQPTYPHDVLALARKEPRPLRLSQQEQLRSEAAAVAAAVTRAPPQVEQLEIHSPDTSLADILNHPDEADSDSDGLAGDDAEEKPSAPLDLDELLASAAAQSLGSIAFEPAVTQSSLAGIANSLNRSSRVEVLWHQSWVQPITRQARAIMIQAGQRYDDGYELEGSLSFHRERYIHLRPQLWYTRYQPRQPLESAPDATSSFAQDLLAVEARRYAPVQTWQMTQPRRLPSGEVHYLDHPLFGLIVRVRKYEWE